jgi:molecular chaperone DnaK
LKPLARFDIDANGIVHVSAKDLATNKEQSIKITASSGLSEEEINNMVKDAEAHAEEDKKKRAVVEARNNLDSLIYMTEKNLNEYGDKIDSSEKANIESAMQDAKKALESNDADTIKSAADRLTQVSHKLAEAMYAKASQTEQQQTGTEETGKSQEEQKKSEEDVVEAEFEEVKEDK